MAAKILIAMNVCKLYFNFFFFLPKCRTQGPPNFSSASPANSPSFCLAKAVSELGLSWYTDG